MDQIDLNKWLTGDDDIMDTLVGLASLPDEPSSCQQDHSNAGADIFEYLLQTGTHSAFQQPISVQQTQPYSTSSTTTTTATTTAAPTATTAATATTALQPPNQLTRQQSTPVTITNPVFRASVSVVQEKDNFVTFMPRSTTAIKKQPSAAPKKTKFKEPIFVTESPQSYKNKKKQSAATNTFTHHSSAEDNSEDDVMLDDEPQSSNQTSSSLKQMTSKERRQLRNKISARNFRVRRKEYITQLEEKVEEHEKTIDNLKKENEKLRLANQELMKQLLVQPITPPSTSGDESLSSSSSEGNNSPDAVAQAYHFQLDNLYDFNLFDQQVQQAQQQMHEQHSNLFYLNHATMPDWDMTRVLGEKGQPIPSQSYQRELSRELINDYPLLAPALMSIVLRHTLSLEYVIALAKEFSEKVGNNQNELGDENHNKSTVQQDQETLCGADDLDDLKSSFDTLKVEDVQATLPSQPEEKQPTELELTDVLLSDFFSCYVMYRARGMSHKDIIDKFTPFLSTYISSYQSSGSKKQAKQKAHKEYCKSNNSSKGNGLQTLQAYCRVASNLLRHPRRMAHVSNVLKKEIDFTHNKHTARVESHYKSLFSSAHKPRLTH